MYGTERESEITIYEEGYESEITVTEIVSERVEELSGDLEDEV